MANPAPAAGGAAQGAVALPFSQELNLSQPATWYGNGSDPLTPAQFLSDIDQRRRRCGWSDVATLHFVGVSLKGPALDWFRTCPMVATVEEDRLCFSGLGPDPWNHFQKLFTRAFLVGGKTHRVDQRAVFRQMPNESIIAYRARCLEVYKIFREERAASLRDALQVTTNLGDAQLRDALNCVTINTAHFGHEAPNPGEQEGRDDATTDAETREDIYGRQVITVRQLLINELAALNRHMIQKTEDYLAIEFSNYLLIDGIHHTDVRKYAMDLVEKKQEGGPMLLWDLVHKFSDAHHPSKTSTAPSEKNTYVPNAGVAGLTRAQADALDKNGRKNTPGAKCGYCGKMNHKEKQCFKKRNDTRSGKIKKGGQAAAAEGQQQTQQQQQQQGQQSTVVAAAHGEQGAAQTQVGVQPQINAAAIAAAQQQLALAQQQMQLQQQALGQQNLQPRMDFQGHAGAVEVPSPLSGETLNSIPWC